jgi:hypothetical protein
VTGDADRLMQVMSNLMSNAAKFSPEGTAVTLGIEDRGEAWRVYVSDLDRAFRRTARKTLFDNFTQVARNDGKRHQGTGLGLAICREIVSRHHQGRSPSTPRWARGPPSTSNSGLDESVAADNDRPGQCGMKPRSDDTTVYGRKPGTCRTENDTSRG